MSFYTLEKLNESSLLSKPAKLAVIGKPIAHSASPRLHQVVLDKENIQTTYIRLEVEIGKVSQAFRMMGELGFIGCNITVPHKLEALEACTEVSDQARILGAVNTVIFSQGKTIGYNTDGPGFEKAIHASFGLELRNSRCVILGAGGGAGQAIATQCALANTSKLILVNRSVDKIESLAKRLRFISPDTEIIALCLSDPALKDYCLHSGLLVQTTSLGLKSSDPEVIPQSYFSSETCAYDTIYSPPETPFLTSAKKANCKTDNGLSLLIHQGALAFQHWFPGTNPLPIMEETMR